MPVYNGTSSPFCMIKKIVTALWFQLVSCRFGIFCHSFPFSGKKTYPQETWTEQFYSVRVSQQRILMVYTSGALKLRLSWESACIESQNNFKVSLPWQAAYDNFCDSLLSVRVVAGCRNAKSAWITIAESVWIRNTFIHTEENQAERIWSFIGN